MVLLFDEGKIGISGLWAIGVGSAIGGSFFGWAFLMFGGVLSATFAFLFASLFYWLYAGVITELAARYKTSGGSFDFVKNAIGIRSAAVMVILGFFKLILSNASSAMAISSYLYEAGMPRRMKPFCWLTIYVAFTSLDCLGVKTSAKVQILATLLCVLILLFYAFSSFAAFKTTNASSNMYTTPMGFFKCLPFGIVFFSGFEDLPLLISDSDNPEINMPAAIRRSYFTIGIVSFLVFLSGVGVSPTDTLLQSSAPLMIGIDIVYGEDSPVANTVSFLIVSGQLVTFFAFMLYISQQVAVVAEDGIMPKFLAYRHPIHRAPIWASVTSSLCGLFLCGIFYLIIGENRAQQMLITASLMPALLSYTLLLQCIVEIRAAETRLSCVSDHADHRNPRDFQRIGYDPGTLRFAYGAYGARFCQAMALLLVGSLLCIATMSAEYMYTLVLVVGALLYVFMYTRIGTMSSAKVDMNGVGYQKIEDGDEDSNIRTDINGGESDGDEDRIIGSNLNGGDEERNLLGEEDSDKSPPPAIGADSTEKVPSLRSANSPSNCPIESSRTPPKSSITTNNNLNRSDANRLVSNEEEVVNPI